MAETARPPLAQPRQPSNALNPFTGGEVSAAASRGNGLVSVEQQRAIAETQARMLIARANPRDPLRAAEAILNDCTRPTLADAAIYQYSRGGTDIRGPSIRLAEAMAQRWGNIASGFKEIARHGEYSECVAYAWDLETGFYDERQFQVRHWRETRQGGYQLTDERDIYELIANFAQRRKRAVLLTVIPGDVTEAALEQCERTMEGAADVTPEGIKRLVDAFAQFGVTPQQLEMRIQRRLDAIRPAQVVQLRKVFNSLRDGMSEPGDWFAAPEPDEGQAQDGPAAPAQRPAEPQRRRRGSREPAGEPARHEPAPAEAGDAPQATASPNQPGDPVDRPREATPRQAPPEGAPAHRARRVTFEA